MSCPAGGFWLGTGRKPGSAPGTRHGGLLHQRKAERERFAARGLALHHQDHIVPDQRHLPAHEDVQ